MSTGIPPELVGYLSRDLVVPFVGSGVSLGIGAHPTLPNERLFPTWSGLLLKLADRLEHAGLPKQASIVRNHADPELNELNEAAEKAVTYLGEARFQAAMREIFDIKHAPAGVTLDLPRAVWALKTKLVVTTNYERVLEWSHPESRTITQQDNGNLNILFNGTIEQPHVWHLHGHIQSPDSLILAPQQYRPLYVAAAKDHSHAWHAAHRKLSTLIDENHLLFVGFGLRDEFFMDALETALNAFHGKLRESYAFLHRSDDRAAELWKKFKVQVIPFDGYEKLPALLQDLAQQAEAVRRGGKVVVSSTRPQLPPSYRDWLDQQCARVAPLGMEANRKLPLKLTEIYVPALTSSSEFDLSNAERRQQTEPRIRQQPVLHLLADRSLYLAGDPGTGKSTFCKWLAWLVAHGEMPRFDPPTPDAFAETFPTSLKHRLPILVRLREFRDYLPSKDTGFSGALFETALRRWLNTVRPGGLSWGDVEPALKAGQTLLILDGVDEVPLSEGEGDQAYSPRSMLLSGLLEAATGWQQAGNRLLVTSRPYGVSDTQRAALAQAGLPEARFDPLPEKLQDLLAQRWFKDLPQDADDAANVAQAMLKEVRSLDDKIKELVANPLLLTAICIIYAEGKQLPQDMHDLYRRIVNAALHARYDSGPSIIDPVRARLAVIALGLHTGQHARSPRSSPVAEVSYHELHAILTAYKQATPETESSYQDVVDERERLLNRSGLLLQNGPERASFYHLSFQEFLAAEQLAKDHKSLDSLAHVFRQRASQPGWRPTLNFLFGRIVAENWQDGRDLLIQLQDSIYERITDMASQLGLAMSCVDGWGLLLRRVDQLQPPVVDRLKEIAVAAIEQSVDVKPRWELARLLMRLGDTRIPSDLRTSAMSAEHRSSRVGLQARPSPATKSERAWRPTLPPIGWVTVPAGPYAYGKNNQPYEIEQSFRLSKYPVTNAQYQHFMSEQGYEQKQFWSDAGWQWRLENKITSPREDLWQDAKWNGATQPVVGVSWYEAEAFCAWLSQAVPGARLPTEKEWEAAARHFRQADGTAREYPWGEWKEGEESRCNYAGTNLGVTNPVGMFPTGAAVCYAEELAGNVWEWCSNYYSDANTNQGRVLRGGSWNFNQRGCRSSDRDFSHPEYRNNLVGFRVART